jgi:7-carboxy-7-deazaguanine synthase
MSYVVKEVFLTLQGEGANTGRAAVFCRFTGCNLWNGHEADRPQAVCRFCDTDFVGTDGTQGGRYPTAAELTDAILAAWKGGKQDRFVVFTGGEPTLQLDQTLLDAVRARGFTVAIETNGTRRVLSGVDWVCVSPKAGAPLVQTRGDELKVVVPQEGLDPVNFERLDFEHFFVQPCDGPAVAANTRGAIDFCLAHPRWRLSTQTHKLAGIP